MVNSIYQFANRSYAKDYLWRVSLSGLDKDWFDAAAGGIGNVIGGGGDKSVKSMGIGSIATISGAVILPAHTVQETLWNVTKKDYEIPGGQFSHPHKKILKSIYIEFYDTVDRVVETSLAKWANEIVDEDGYVAPLKTITRNLTVYKLNMVKVSINYNSYSVYPYGEYKFKGTSNPDTSIIGVNFAVAGETGSSIKSVTDFIKKMMKGMT